MSAEPPKLEATGAGTDAGTDAGAGAGEFAVADTAALTASKTNTTEPSLTLSPNLTFNSFTTPACDDGISIDALSDSTVMSDCSALTVSPGLTNNSITATSSKSPMSGTLISISAIKILSMRVRKMTHVPETTHTESSRSSKSNQNAIHV